MSEIRLPAHDSNHHAWHSRGQFPETCHPCAREVIKRQSEALAIAVEALEAIAAEAEHLMYGWNAIDKPYEANLIDDCRSALVRISQQQEGDKR